MAVRGLIKGPIYLSQTIIAILGNFTLLYHHTFLYCTKCRSRSMEFIVENSLIIFCKGVPQTRTTFGLKDNLSDFGCKLVSHVHRVVRIVPIDWNYLLSVFQVITINPRVSRYAFSHRL
jgi:vomeronasal1 receptor